MGENVSMPLCDIQELQAQIAELKELLNYIRDEIADMPSTALQLGFGWISEAASRIDNKLKETSDAEDSDSN